MWFDRGEALAESLRNAGLGDKVRLVVHPGPGEPSPEVMAEADALVSWGVAPGTLARMPRLRWIQAMATGIDAWLKRADMHAGITLTCARGVQSEAMAENALGCVFLAAKHFPLFARQQQQKDWRVKLMEPIAGKTIGILGLGAVGATLARQASAIGMRVLGLKRQVEAVPHVERVYPLDDIDGLLAESDYVVVLLPSTPATLDLLNRDRFARMKPGAWIVNFARGDIIVDADLIEAVQNRTVGGAVLDVFRKEPLPADHAYWTTENIVVLPHVGGRHGGREGMVADLMADNLTRFLDGRPLREIVDPAIGY